MVILIHVNEFDCVFLLRVKVLIYVFVFGCLFVSMEGFFNGCFGENYRCGCGLWFGFEFVLCL